MQDFMIASHLNNTDSFESNQQKFKPNRFTEPPVNLMPVQFVTKTKKVFVGGIQHGTSENDLKEYFEKFGDVTEVVIMFDKITTRCRGFGFVTFDNEDCVDKCCDERYHIINSKRVS